MENKPKLELVEVSRRSHRSSGAGEGRTASENGETRPRRRQDGSGEHRRRMQQSGGELPRQRVGRYRDYGSVNLGELPSRPASEDAPEAAKPSASEIPVVPSAASGRTEDRYAFILKRKYRKRNRLVPFLVFGGLAVLLVGLLMMMLLRSGGEKDQALSRPNEESIAQEEFSEQNDEMIETN